MSCRIELTGAAAFEFGVDEVEFPADLAGDGRVFLGAADEIGNGVLYRSVRDVFRDVVAAFSQHVRKVVAHSVEL